MNSPAAMGKNMVGMPLPFDLASADVASPVRLLQNIFTLIGGQALPWVPQKSPQSKKRGHLPEMLVSEGVTGAGFEVAFQFGSLLLSLNANCCYEFPRPVLGCVG